MKRFLIVIFLSIGLNFLPQLFEGEKAWYIFSMTKQFEVFMWIAAGMSVIPYRYLFVKSICAIWAVLALIDSFGYLAYLSFEDLYYPIYFLKASGSLLWVLYIWFRDYERGNDELDDVHFFKVSIRPNSPQDFILSLIKDPVGGTGIFARGKFYHYRKGYFCVHDYRYIKKSGNKYRIEKKGRIDPRRIAELEWISEDPKYFKWTILHNCKTVIEPILGDRRKPWI